MITQSPLSYNPEHSHLRTLIYLVCVMSIRIKILSAGHTLYLELFDVEYTIRILNGVNVIIDIVWL
jgi:hypothetical protein